MFLLCLMCWLYVRERERERQRESWLQRVCTSNTLFPRRDFKIRKVSPPPRCGPKRPPKERTQSNQTLTRPIAVDCHCHSSGVNVRITFSRFDLDIRTVCDRYREREREKRLHLVKCLFLKESIPNAEQFFRLTKCEDVNERKT